MYCLPFVFPTFSACFVKFITDLLRIIAKFAFSVDGENQFVCLWTSCLKYRKEGK